MTNVVRLGGFISPFGQLVLREDGHRGRRFDLDAAGVGVVRVTVDGGADKAAASTAAQRGVW